MSEKKSSSSPILKYGLMGLTAGILGAFLSIALGISEDPTTSFVTAIAGCTLGGLFAGWRKQNKGERV